MPKPNRVSAVAVTLLIGIALVAVANGAALKNVSGNVLVSGATGLRSAANGMQLPAGARVLTTSTGAATISVSPGCDVMLAANQRWSQPAAPGCDAARAAVEGVRTQMVSGAQIAPAVVPATRRSTVTIDASTLFPHSKFALPDTFADGRKALDDLARKVDAECTGVERVVVEGHADISNSTRDEKYNDRLSLARAVTVRDYLSSRFAKPYSLEAIGFGHTAPVKTSCVYPRGSKLTSGGLEQGSASSADMAALAECLQPNRRVVVRVEGQGLVCGVPPVAAAQPAPPPAPPVVPPPAAPVVPPPAAPVAVVVPPAVPVPAVVAPATFPTTAIIGTTGAVGLGVYIYNRDRRNVSPN
jgi:outer membrane protein OmpA-like peptidoglycan-associated protein